MTVLCGVDLQSLAALNKGQLQHHLIRARQLGFTMIMPSIKTQGSDIKLWPAKNVRSAPMTSIDVNKHGESGGVAPDSMGRQLVVVLQTKKGVVVVVPVVAAREAWGCCLTSTVRGLQCFQMGFCMKLLELQNLEFICVPDSGVWRKSELKCWINSTCKSQNRAPN